jgi:hypothetical protein
VSSRKIWDAAPHNAFTDLVQYRGAWYCVFREGTKHVSPDGAIRVITSVDGEEWSSAALLKSDAGDLRDPKMVLTPQGALMLTSALASASGDKTQHQTLAWYSRDGRAWGAPREIGELNIWLWRVTWRDGEALGIGYDTQGEHFVRLYRSENGRDFTPLVPRLFDREYPNESSIVFDRRGKAICLLRRDGQPGSGMLGLADPPYAHWEWKDLGVKIGGPHMLRLADGRLVAAVRLYDGGPRTSLGWIDPQKGSFTEALRLPSGGDTSYAGLAWDRGLLWISYYSSHGGKTAIHLAKVRLLED